MSTAKTFNSSLSDILNDVPTSISIAPTLNSDYQSSLTSDPVSMATAKLMADITRCYIIPVMSAMGIVGNTLSLLTLCVLVGQQVMHVMLVALAVSDVVYILFTNLDTVICILQRFDPLAASNLTIISYVHALWFRILFSRISNVLTSCIAVQRCVVVCFPLKARVFVTRFALCVTAVMAYVITTGAHVLLFLRNEVIWMTFQGNSSGETRNITVARLRETSFSIQHSHWLDWYKDLLLNILFRLVPMATVFLCTGVILSRLQRQQQWRHQEAGTQNTGSGRSRDARETRLTVTLVWLCAVFLLCSLPGLLIFFGRLAEPQFDYYGTYSVSFDVAMLVKNVFEVLNSSVNFLVYVPRESGFVQALRRIFCRGSSGNLTVEDSMATTNTADHALAGAKEVYRPSN